MTQPKLLRFTVGIPGEPEQYYVDVIAEDDTDAIIEYCKIKNDPGLHKVAKIMDVNEQLDHDTSEVDENYFPG